MVQVGLDGLSPELKAKLAMVILVVPGDTVDYRVSPAELFDLIAPDASALPTARRLDWIPTLCIQGAEETDSLCPHLTAPNVRKVALPGGHPLHRDADALYAPIAQAIGQRAVQ
jgi:type IV secretory pathway VirJ component